MSASEKTVLIVDDDVDFLTQTQVQLQAAGYHVVAAESLKQADEALAAGRPDAAIIDLMMEETDAGFVLAHRIKRLDPAIPVIMVTAVTSQTGLQFDTVADDARFWIKADVILDKPVRFEQLTRELERLM